VQSVLGLLEAKGDPAPVDVTGTADRLGGMISGLLRADAHRRG